VTSTALYVPCQLCLSCYGERFYPLVSLDHDCEALTNRNGRAIIDRCKDVEFSGRDAAEVSANAEVSAEDVHRAACGGQAPSNKLSNRPHAISLRFDLSFTGHPHSKLMPRKPSRPLLS
jgi:hypothetical protein